MKIETSYILQQKGYVIFYESRMLNEHEKNYVTHNLEVATIVQDLKWWRQYLLARIFVLMKEHGGLIYLCD